MDKEKVEVIEEDTLKKKEEEKFVIPNKQIEIKRLNFRIIEVSSEDRENPAYQLLKGQESLGWLSDRFCDYPQEIILQFPLPVQLKQINILSHESKISSKIEVYSFNPTSEMNVDFFPYYKNLAYLPLGYVKLSENSRTNFKAREHRRIYLDTTCVYLKIILMKNHSNMLNIFNQVGLINIEVFGNPLAVHNIKQSNLFINETLRNQEVTEDKMDEICLEKFRVLRNNLEIALKREDYDEAKRIKKNSEVVKNIGKKIYNLEFQKKIYINNEDYDNAKILKFEIERLRSNVRNIEKHIMSINPVNFSGEGRGQIFLEKSQIETFYNFANDASRQHNNDASFDKSRQDFTQTYRSVFHTNNQEEIYKPHEDQVVPALNKYKNINIEDQTEDIEESKREEVKVDDNIFNEYSSLCGDFPEEQLKFLLFSKHIPSKEEGLDSLEENIANILKKGDQLEVLLKLATYMITNDTHPQLVIKVFDILNEVISYSEKNKLEFNSSLIAINKIKNSLGESNPKLRGKAIDLYIRLFTAKLVGIKYEELFLELFDLNGTVTQKNITGRFKVLEKAAFDNPRISSEQQNLPLKELSSFCVTNLKSAKLEVRNLAKAMILRIYRDHGSDTLKNDLLTIDEKELLKLKTDIPEVEEIATKKRELREQALNIKKPLTKKKTQEDDEYDPKDMANSDKRLIKTDKKTSKKDLLEVDKNKKSTNSKKCKFCELTDRRFLSESELDKHCATECRYLTECFKCSKLIEIPQLKNHLLAECEKSSDFKLCKRCREPIESLKLDNHTKESKCIPAKNLNSANRCLLCHKDIPPGDKGWKTHILINGCESNLRKLPTNKE